MDRDRWSLSLGMDRIWLVLSRFYVDRVWWYFNRFYVDRVWWDFSLFCLDMIRWDPSHFDVERIWWLSCSSLCCMQGSLAKSVLVPAKIYILRVQVSLVRMWHSSLLSWRAEEISDIHKVDSYGERYVIGSWNPASKMWAMTGEAHMTREVLSSSAF